MIPVKSGVCHEPQPPTEHQLLVFWVGLLVILVAARLLGAVMQRIGQPAVIGELAAGLILGPSVLGKLAPDITDWLFPADDVQTGMLFTVGWLGVLFLLVSTGFETDLGLIGRLGRRRDRVGRIVAGSGDRRLRRRLVSPDGLRRSDTERYIFALFVAAALSISSLPVIAKILGEMGLMRRNFGQLTLAAGMANDVIGWVALGLIAGLRKPVASSSTSSPSPSWGSSCSSSLPSRSGSESSTPRSNGFEPTGVTNSPG